MSNFGRQIEAFRAVMLTGGMTTAAETLRITQPAISRLIRDLEDDLKIALFHRRGNQITPTVEATAFLAEVERSYLGMDQLRTFVVDLRNSLTGSLRIAALPAMALGFMPYCLAKFSGTRPKLSITLDGIPSHLVLERVAGGQFELGFAAVPADRPMLNTTPIKARAVVVMPEGHPLAKNETVSADQLRNERIVMLDRGNYLRHTIERVLGMRGGSPGAIETPLSAIACSFVARGLGVTIIDAFTAINFLGRGIEARPLVPELDFGFAMVTAQQRPMSQLARQFAQEIHLLAEEYQSPIFG
ncbi:LysR family transcriptional regulator [Agrobacterium tumefaciens]|uniref:LysR family transcriptional regulator n=1 Tax=Agrobacterium tumefaciens TaxID=358 RepID=UPI001571BEC4|nr:LysR family transcriptional regulator [Agrobacterium tumefaciens]NSX89026.1 LysR family transcriptional regulator [Agrobacterium tumefaciens]